MDINHLYQEIESLGIDQNSINIGDIESYDGRFNLHHRKDGKWEIFYGIYGQKRKLQVYSSEEKACDAFVRVLKKDLKNKERHAKHNSRISFRKNASSIHRKLMIGISLFCMLIGIFFAGVQIYIKDYGYMFWVFIAWIIIFGLLAYGYKDDKSAGELEYVAQPVAFGILTLLCIAAMIVVPVFLMPSIMTGDTDDLTTLITTELVCGIFGFIFFYFNVKSYITEFINHIRSTSRKTEQKQSSKDDGDL